MTLFFSKTWAVGGMIGGMLLPRAAAEETVPVSATGQAEHRPTVMENYEVTGSRIKRLDFETPSPVIVLTRETLAVTGFSEMDEVMRSLSIGNGPALSLEGSGNALATGTTSVNLRGLGNNQTLVLIDGRRASPAGVGGFNGFQSVIDLRQVPLAWVESIEILKDGASAIYGSDAVSGVVNIKLRKNYSGVNVSLQIGNTLGTDSFQRSGSFVTGVERGKTQVVVMGAAAHRNAIKDIDYAFSATADLRANRSGSAQVETDPTGMYTTGYDQRSATTFPARFLPPGASSSSFSSFLVPTTDPSLSKATPGFSYATGAGLYDFQKETYLRPETDSRSVRLLLRHEFNEQLHGRVDFSFQRGKILNAAASSPFSTTDKGDGAAGRLVVPADSPFNPYGTRYFPNGGQAIELIGFRLVNAGPRFHDVVSNYPRLLGVLGGRLPAGWEWESAYLFSKGTYRDKAPGASFDSKVQAALKGVVIDGEKLYANPFGPEDPRITRSYSGENPTRNSFTSHLADFSVRGDLFNLPTGTIGFAGGGELRHERLRDIRTQANETGDIVGGSEGFGFSGSRRVMSVYAELKVPVLKSLEFQLAGRFENYSDFGTTTKPKIAFGYRPASWLMVRGSFSQSFKAPDLAYLYGKGNVSFTASSLSDPRRPTTPISRTQIRTLGRGNQALKPEETDTYYGGVAIEVPRGPLRGFTVDFGYFKFDQTNAIARDDAPFTLNNELRLPAGRVVRKPLTDADAAAGYTVGTIDFLANDWYNADRYLRDGYDLSLSYPLKTKALGQFNFSVDTNYLANAERTTTNSLGVRSTIDEDGKDPLGLWRGTGSIAWRKGVWSSAIYVVGLGGFNVSALGKPQFPMKDQYTVNPQLGYRGWRGTQITVGVRNALNEDPPRYLDNQTGYFPQVSRAEKAFWYLRLARDF